MKTCIQIIGVIEKMNASSISTAPLIPYYYEVPSMKLGLGQEEHTLCTRTGEDQIHEASPSVPSPPMKQV